MLPLYTYYQNLTIISKSSKTLLRIKNNKYFNTYTFKDTKRLLTVLSLSYFTSRSDPLVKIVHRTVESLH